MPHARFRILTDHKSLLWLLRLHGDKGRLSRWGLLMSQWHIVAVPNKENATNVDRSLSYEPRSQMHAPDCGSRMYDPEDGGQEPPKDREDITLHISLATSHRADDEHMDNSVNVLGQGGTRSGTTDNHMHGVHDEDMSDGEEPTNKDNAEPRVPDIGSENKDNAEPRGPDIGSENILGTGRIPTLKQIGDAQSQCEFYVIFLKEQGKELAPVSEEQYANYADYLHEHLHTSIQLYRDAKMMAIMKSNDRHDGKGKIKNASQIPWLQPRQLVIVYRPTSVSQGAKWSSKLLFQFTGPYRIVAVHRGAVRLETLDGQPASPQNLRNVYPYHCHVDDLMDSFDRSLLTQAERNATSLELEGHMVIVDLSDDHGPDFRVARLVNKLDEDTFFIHYYDSPSKGDISKRAFFPAYRYSVGRGRSKEVCTLTPPSGALPMETAFKLNEILLKPFHLTQKHHIPKEICEKLLPQGYIQLVSWFNSDSDRDMEKRTLKRKDPPLG